MQQAEVTKDGWALPELGLGDFEDVKDVVAAAFCVSTRDLISKNNARARSLVMARKMLVYVARETTSLSYPELGRAMDRDHTTIMYLDRDMRFRVKNNEHMRRVAERIIAECKRVWST